MLNEEEQFDISDLELRRLSLAMIGGASDTVYHLVDEQLNYNRILPIMQLEGLLYERSYIRTFQCRT